MTMVATVTLNASVDTTGRLARLERGAINRLDRSEAVAGGKGNNVARVLATLGQRVVASGFVAGAAGRFIVDSLRAEGVEPAFREVPGESRTCLTLVEADGTVTEVREPGPTVAAADAAAFLRDAPELLAGAAVAVLSGGLPPGLPPDYYADLIGALRGAGIATVLDSSGEALRRGVAAGPGTLKPNTDELADLLGGPVAPGGEVAAARRLAAALPAGTTLLLTLGRHGAALVTATDAVLAAPPPVSVVNTVGAGDAFVAGWVDATVRGHGPVEALRRAVATGAAATMQSRIGAVDPADVARLLPQVRVAA